jgi:hypothetical protein
MIGNREKHDLGFEKICINYFLTVTSEYVCMYLLLQIFGAIEDLNRKETARYVEKKLLPLRLTPM